MPMPRRPKRILNVILGAVRDEVVPFDAGSLYRCGTLDKRRAYASLGYAQEAFTGAFGVEV